MTDGDVPGTGSPITISWSASTDNFGVVGYTAFQGLRLWKEKVRAYQPDCVVIGFGACNEVYAQEHDISRVRFWKIDTEGSELPALRGARGGLSLG